MQHLKNKSVTELLKLHVAVGEELLDRKVMRSANNPTGDLAESLFCRSFDWKQAPNSEHGFDAKDADGCRYQIKSRRMHKRNTSRQLSALRNLQESPFDVLAGVLFTNDYSILKACLIPVSTVIKRATFTSHTNSHRFMLTDEIWELEDVEDVTERLRATRL
ncbi:hypothetical protein MNBD_ALPHA08-2331 [hydrothermal vent metagenome]|uniref:Uncharacterized protein n=1 Tax=hydrothermal vent metagenome TaxID=652676 RepID=A0A3B0S224_9ZZZZ